MKTGMMGFPINMGIPQLMGVLPGMTAVASGLMKQKMKELDVPPVKEMLEMLHDAGAKIYACKMTVDMMKLQKEDFLELVDGIVTASEFIDMTENAQIIFI